MLLGTAINTRQGGTSNGPDGFEASEISWVLPARTPCHLPRRRPCWVQALPSTLPLEGQGLTSPPTLGEPAWETQALAA